METSKRFGKSSFKEEEMANASTGNDVPENALVSLARRGEILGNKGEGRRRPKNVGNRNWGIREVVKEIMRVP